MLLAIEQGNTNTMFAVHDGERWTAQWRAGTDSTRTADDYAVWLSQLLAMAGLQFASLDDCIISSVVPQSIFNLRTLAGVAEGLDLDGALRLRLDDGTLERVTAGDVFFGSAT